jgi:hypothetical protein
MVLEAAELIFICIEPFTREWDCIHHSNASELADDAIEGLNP